MNVTIRIDDTKCSHCFECIEVCPENALTYFRACFEHNPNKCSNCEVCSDCCPTDALKIKATW